MPWTPYVTLEMHNVRSFLRLVAVVVLLWCVWPAQAVYAQAPATWTATILHVGPPGDRVDVDVRFTKGDQTVDVRYSTTGTLANLLPKVRTTIARLEAYLLKTTLRPGQIIVGSPPAPVPTPVPIPVPVPVPTPVPVPGAVLATPHFTAGAATFGLALPLGAASGSLRVGALETQTDVKNRWPDGSIKFAVVSGIVSTTGSYPVVAAATSTATSFPVQWPTVTVKLGTYTATLPAASAADAWLTGSVVRESRVLLTPMDGVTPHPWLRVLVDVRAYRTGAQRLDVTLENIHHAGGRSETYDISVLVNTQEVYAKSQFTHFYATRHRLPRFAANGYVESIVSPDVAPFVAAKAFPAYQASIVDSLTDQMLADRATTGELGKRGLGLSTDNMGDVGGRGEIAPYGDWIAQYLIHKTPNGRTFTLGTDDRAGSWPIHFADDQRRIIRTDRAPGAMNYWMDGRGVTHPLGTADPAMPLRPDHAHMPSLGFASYLITGDRFYLDEMKFWASHSLLGAWPEDSWFPRDERVNPVGVGSWVTTRKGKGFVSAINGDTFSLNPPSPNGPVITVDRSEIGQYESLILSGEVRAIAWRLRNIVDAAAYTPDADEDQAYFHHVVDQNLQRLDFEAQAGGTMRGPYPFDALWLGKGLFPGSVDVTQVPWQNYMTLWSVGRAMEHGVWGTHGTTYAAKVSTWLVRLFSSEAEGFPRWYANASALTYGEYENDDFNAGVITWLPSLAEVFRVTTERMDGRRLSFAGYHGLEVWAALVVAERLGIVGVSEAIAYLLANDNADVAGMQSYLNQRAGWAIQR